MIVENGIKSEGLLERGYDWYVQFVALDSSALSTVEFNGVLSSWKQKLTARAIAKPAPAKNPAELTVGELLSNMKPAQLWALIGTIATLIAGAFAFGAKFK